MADRKSHLDPRIRRTRAYLREALIDLVLEKGYQGITIKDLADRACINRSTFYLHYQDKDDLLITGFEEYWDQVLPGCQLFIYQKPILPADRLLAVLERDLRHIDQLRDFYRITLSEGEIPYLRDIFFKHLLKIIQGRFSPQLSLSSIPAVPLQLVHNWLASAYFGVILYWLAADQPASIPVLASQLGTLFLHQMEGTFQPTVLPQELWARQEQIA